MRAVDGHILLSASDLMRFMGCTHSTTLDLARLRGEGPEPRADSEDAELLQKQGDAHEAAHLARLKSEGRTVVEIRGGDLDRDADATRAALAAGPDVVFQGALRSGRWGGWSDFLERIDRPSVFGDFSYEVADTKLKRRPHPKHVLQLVLYSDLLAEVQDAAPEHAHVELGDGTRASFRLAGYAHYARAARARLEAFIDAPVPTRPVPCADCALCRWAGHCAEVWEREDSLFTVANITRGQVKKLEAAGITTMAAFPPPIEAPSAAWPPPRWKSCSPRRDSSTRASRAIRISSFARMCPARASIFCRSRNPAISSTTSKAIPITRAASNICTGSGRMAASAPSGRIEHGEEAKALSDLLDYFRERLERFPEARIYHYAPYEVTALRRLTTKYGIGEAFLDRLQRERRFVDLYAVVRGGLIASEPNYSIKSLEVFYGLAREGEVTTAGGSVVAYERWRETADQAILDEIEDYNRIDCISTERLRDWLVGIRPAAPGRRSARRLKKRRPRRTPRRRHCAQLAASGLPEERQAMLFDLGLFHKREAKPAASGPCSTAQARTRTI